MKISNGHIGEIEVDEGNVITFPEGMLGLPRYKRYVIVQGNGMAPFLRLQCIDEPSISFLTIDPAFADQGYRTYVEAQDRDNLFIESSEDTVLLVVCTVSKDGSDLTCNLQAPVIINHKAMTGKQVVLLDSPYSIRHSLVKGKQEKRGA